MSKQNLSIVLILCQAIFLFNSAMLDRDAMDSMEHAIEVAMLAVALQGDRKRPYCRGNGRKKTIQ